MVAMIRQLAEFGNRVKFMLQAGITYDGARDTYAALGYKKLLLTAVDYRPRFLRGGIATRVVDAYPKATWRGGAEIIDDEDPEIVTVFEEQWEVLCKRLNIWSVFCRVDTLAGLGRYGGLLIGASGELNTELPNFSSPDDILYLSAFAEDELVIQTLEQDTESERFGLPLTYTLNRKTPLVSLPSLNKPVHWSRIVHVADGSLDDTVWGTPRLESVWNYLDDLDKCVGGGSEAFWQRVHQGYFFKIDPEAKISESDITKMREQAEDFANNLKRTMAMRGTDVSVLGSDVSSFGPQVTMIISLISGTTGIPQRIFMGSERGELASTQDKENWNIRVADRRTNFAEPSIVRPFIKRMIEYGALPEPNDGDYTVRWPDIEELTQIERANVATQWSGLNSKAGGTVVLPEEIRDRILRLDKLSPEDLPDTDPKSPNYVAPPVIDPNVDPNADPNADDPNAPPDKNARSAKSSRPKGETQVGRQSAELPTDAGDGSEAS